MSRFSDEFGRLIAERRMGVRELAAKSGVSAGYISRLRNGQQSPSPDTAAKLDTALQGSGALVAAAGRRDTIPKPDQHPVPAPSGGRASLPAGVKPAEHLHALRRVLIAEEDALGPVIVNPILISHIELIRQLRRMTGGADGDELLLLEAMYAEFAAWCAQDLADFRAAGYWLDRALELAHMTLDPVWPAYILARKAQLAVDMHDPVHATGLARAAIAASGGDYRARLSAVAATYAAQGHALAQDGDASARALDSAREGVADGDDGPRAPWMGWLDPFYVAVHEARSKTILGRHTDAAETYAAAISGLPGGMTRERGLHTARMAVAYANAGEFDAASEAATDALAIAQLTGSGRIVMELRRLSAALSGIRGGPAVALREVLATVVRPPRRRPT